MGNLVPCNSDIEQLSAQDLQRPSINIRGTFHDLNREEKITIADDPNMRSDVYKLLKNYKQKHIVEFFPTLTQEEKAELIDQVAIINFGLMDMLFHQLVKQNIKLRKSDCKIKVENNISNHPIDDPKYEERYEKGLKAISIGKGNIISVYICYYR